MLLHLEGQHPWDGPEVQVGGDPAGLDGHQVTTHSCTCEDRTQRLSGSQHECAHRWRSNTWHGEHFSFTGCQKNPEKTAEFIMSLNKLGQRDVVMAITVIGNVL